MHFELLFYPDARSVQPCKQAVDTSALPSATAVHFRHKFRHPPDKVLETGSTQGVVTDEN